VSFSQAYYTKNKKCAMQKHNASLLDILRGSIIIPGELLSSRAHFRLMNSVTKLIMKLYIYNLSKNREGYASKSPTSFCRAPLSAKGL